MLWLHVQLIWIDLDLDIMIWLVNYLLELELKILVKLQVWSNHLIEDESVFTCFSDFYDKYCEIKFGEIRIIEVLLDEFSINSFCNIVIIDTKITCILI